MYPAAFDYVAVRTLDEALSTLSEGDEDTKVLAGGQSLIPMMKLRLATPTKLVDINRVPGLADIRVSDGHLVVGALTRHNDVVHSELVKAENHTMASAAPWIADPLVRNLGTVGGSLAHADPQGDWGSVMLACGAEVVATSSSRGDRTIPVSELFVDLFTSALEPDELLTEVRVPRYTGPAGGAYLKLERKVGDYATVGVAVHLQLDNGRIGQAGIALTGVGSKNIKATQAEGALIGQTPSDELFAEAGQLAAAAADPRTDVRGTAEFKRSIVSTFVRRGLSQAATRAVGQPESA
ncbi:MAG TPA: xanthine dehydrogenase family protein subunit M [Jiangellaceae bacterium]|nr:xanthine dehydrogenase family protein subunit M [Jiangellaceae bacterium]